MSDSTSRLGYSQEQYVKQLDGYRQYENVPWGVRAPSLYSSTKFSALKPVECPHTWQVLEHQLQESALGDCTGLTVLDLGGGNGLRARHVVDHGSIAVDVVDGKPCYMHLYLFSRRAVWKFPPGTGLISPSQCLPR